MRDTLVVNRTPSETRVALMEDGVPVEIYVERERDRSVVGNIYCGKVVRVLPGMQAAFVEIGLERTAFLYVDDAVLDRSLADHERSSGGFENIAISQVLRVGEEILVQVRKAPVGTKGARLSRQINLPGRHLVYVPHNPHIGVSRRIEDETERARLSEIVRAASAQHGNGVVVRTAADGMDGQALALELGQLQQAWFEIEKSSQQAAAPSLVYEELGLALKATRDLFHADLEAIVVDHEKDREDICAFLSKFAPGTESKVRLSEDPVPVFDAFGAENAIERALGRRVWLESGGYLMIDQAEALTAIDVNSGRFVGKRSLEDTTTQINLEAAREVARQLRLRDLGGIIVIDFIDMELKENRERVVAELSQAVQRDRSKINIVGMSELGLVELTRKRARESLSQSLAEPCNHCGGRGFVKSELTVALDVLRSVSRRLLRSDRPGPTVTVEMNESLANNFRTLVSQDVEQLEDRYQVHVVPFGRNGYHRERFEICSPGGE